MDYHHLVVAMYEWARQCNICKKTPAIAGVFYSFLFIIVCIATWVVSINKIN